MTLDYLSELLAIQENGPKNIGFFGTRNTGLMHQRLIEILAYAMVLTGNHIYTSGATGTNAAVIRGALRAPQEQIADNLTIVLPQSLYKQTTESQELLEQVRKCEFAWRVGRRRRQKFDLNSSNRNIDIRRFEKTG